jgi:putative transposase
MSAAVAVTQLAQALDISPKAVRIRAQKDNWPTIRKPKQGGSEMFFIRDLLPVKEKQQLVMHEAATGNQNLPAVIHDTPVPKRSNKVGLAKYNLVHAFRLAKERAGWGEKGKAADAFILAYNAGVHLPQIYEVVGEINIKTLEALDKKLRNNNDNYLCLCDARGGWKKHGTNKYRGRKLNEVSMVVFLRCYLHGSRPSVVAAIRATRFHLEKMEIDEPATDSTFRRWLKDYEKLNAGVICMARDGMKAYRDKYAPYITRDPSLLEVGQCLVADGKTTNFFIKHPETGRPCRMTLIVFFDWRSRYPAGWQILPTENQWGILAAFRNAVQALGRYPDSVYLDNGKAFKSKLFCNDNVDLDFEEMTGLYARVGTAPLFAQPYNGRAKVVERFFKTVQDQLEWIMPSYCGDSIHTKPPWLHRNEKFQRAWHEARTKGWIPTIQDASIIIGRYFQWYAQQPHQDLEAPPEDLFLENRGPGVDPYQLAYDFLWRKKVKPRRCRITLWGIEYESDALHNLSRDMVIEARVDTADLSRVWCYADGTYLGEAYPVMACHPLAKMFGDQVSVSQVEYQIKRQSRMAKNARKQLDALGVTAQSDSLNVISFQPEKVPVMTETGAVKKPAAGQEALPEEKVKQLEAVMKKVEADMEAEPEIPRPKYWSTELERYEWCFRLVHEHGRTADPEDQAFMEEFESRPQFSNYRQRYEDMKELFS